MTHMYAMQNILFGCKTARQSALIFDLMHNSSSKDTQDAGVSTAMSAKFSALLVAGAYDARNNPTIYAHTTYVYLESVNLETGV